MMTDLKKMSKTELKQYLSAHRNNDEAFSQGLEELMSRRDPNAKTYPYDMPPKEVEAILREQIEKKPG